MESSILLEMVGISKSFPGVRALDGVDFRLRAGEVHALIGENGAGKSTLIKILTGVHSKNSGVIRLNGEVIAPESSLEAQELGISSIYQELNLIPSLSVAENIFIGREPRSRFGLISWKTVQGQARELLRRAGLKEDIDVTRKLSRYNTSIQQMVAIARAISIDAKVIVMDEATSSLNEKEVKNLFEVVRRLQKNGIAVVFISHRLDELFEICDRMTVLRDGKLVGEYPTEGLTKLALVSAMIGRDASSIMDSRKQYSEELAQSRDYVCQAVHLKSGTKVTDVSLDVKRGEVLGLSGLLGSGRTETAQVLFGDVVAESGEVRLNGERQHFRKPADAIRKGIGFCPEDRKVDGIVPHMSVLDNITIVLLPELSKRGIISRKAQRDVAAEYVKRLGIKTPDLNQKIRNLSGGNQQKVLLARWLCTNPSLMILDEPTRGIDVGAKSEIESVVADLARRGIAVLMISSELEELTRDCDRVVILREGRSIIEIEGSNISEQRIAEAIASEDIP
jgi:galactofuranose transport system ATP-binding protein